MGIACASLAIGEALGFSFGGGAVAWPLAALSAVLAAAFLRGLGWRIWVASFFFTAGMAVSMRAECIRRHAIRQVELRGGLCEISIPVCEKVRVRRSAHEPENRWITLRGEFAGRNVNVIYCDSVTNALPEIGEVWRCAGWLANGAMDKRATPKIWVRGRGSFVRREMVADPDSLVVRLAAVRDGISSRLGIGLRGNLLAASILRAMILGERSGLTQEMRQTFTAAGTVHVFAISGLHVVIVAGVIFYALLFVGVPYRCLGVLMLPPLIGYVLMIGAPPSAVRAASMAGIWFLAPVFCRRPDSLAAWELTMIGFALCDPIGFFSVGSLLSFAVMLGILLFVRWQRQFDSRLVAWLGVPFAAWAAGVPIVAHEFAQVTPGGLVANLAMVPLAGAAVTSGIAGVLASIVSETLGAHINNLAALFVEAMVGVSWSVSRIPGANFSVEPWNWWQCFAWYAVLILTFSLIKRRNHVL